MPKDLPLEKTSMYKSYGSALDFMKESSYLSTEGFLSVCPAFLMIKVELLELDGSSRYVLRVLLFDLELISYV